MYLIKPKPIHLDRTENTDIRKENPLGLDLL
jgi:hypothetical protein